MMPMVKRNLPKNDRLSFLMGMCIGFCMATLLFFQIQQQSLLLQADNHADDPPDNEVRYESKDIKSSLRTGWRTIHVYVGDSTHIVDASTIPEPYFHANTWFSQFRQDEVVSKLLNGKQNGFFIDLAANDAVRISNTYALERNFGWEGLCLEPNHIYWGGLAYRKCQVVGAVVGNRTMDEVVFAFPKEKAPKGGIVGNEFDNKVEKVGESQRRFTTTLSEIFLRFDVPHVIDYISLDVEGAEDLVMSNFPFSTYRFNVLTLERPSPGLSTTLSSNGYIHLKNLKTRTESIWIHKSMEETINRSALNINTENYKYRDNKGQERKDPGDLTT